MNVLYRNIILNVIFVLCVFAVGCSDEHVTTAITPVLVVESDAENIYLGSPSIAKFKDQYYISHDYYGSGSDKDKSSIYVSNDLKFWDKVTDIGMYWSSLFVFEERLFMLGTDREYGNISIAYTDDGSNWFKKKLYSGYYHTSSLPVLVKDGFAFQTFELAPPPPALRKNWGNFILKLNLRNLDAQKSNIVFHEYDQQWIEGNILSNQQSAISNILFCIGKIVAIIVLELR